MSIVFMRVLESSSNRYDRGIQMLTHGKLDKIYNHVLVEVHPEDRIFEIGCGTGTLTQLVAAKGSIVRAIDINPDMLDIARSKQTPGNDIEFLERSVAEIDAEEDESYDIVLSSLCFSELSDDEISFAIPHIQRILKPEGKLIIIDETVPESLLSKIWFYALRIPLTIITYILTQTTTHPIKRLDEIIQRSGFRIISNDIDGSILTIIATREERK